MSKNGTVECPDVEVIRDTGLVLVCRIGGREVMIPPLQIRRGTTVRHVGDRGVLVIPRWLATQLDIEGHCSDAT